MTREEMALLREPFKPEQVGKLPRVSCKACSEKKGGAPSTRHCDKHTVTKCVVCGAYITTAHIHLDYVGHAAVTDRLLQVDPGWSWWPMALDERGGPMFDAKGGLWIMLKILDVQRPGYGDGDSPKEVIGDAIRNAAMRFGVALDLWAKEPLHSDQDVEPTVAPKKARRASRSASPAPAAAPTPASQRAIMAFASQNSIDDETRHRITRRIAGVTSSKDVPSEMIDKVVAALKWYVDHPESLRKIEEWERDNGFAA